LRLGQLWCPPPAAGSAVTAESRTRYQAPHWGLSRLVKHPVLAYGAWNLSIHGKISKPIHPRQDIETYPSTARVQAVQLQAVAASGTLYAVAASDSPTCSAGLGRAVHPVRRPGPRPTASLPIWRPDASRPEGRQRLVGSRRSRPAGPIPSQMADAVVIAKSARGRRAAAAR
jgi:hypothetical protein